MYTEEYNGINSFLVGMAKTLLKEGVERNTRGYKCWELPEPVMIKIKNPLSRWVTIPNRKWNLFLPYAESLWLATGRNDLNFIKYYLAKMENFSDDGEFLRGGYGPRLRFYNGNIIDYKKPSIKEVQEMKYNELDQFDYIIKSFEKDPYTRQAVITIGDPLKDCFGLNNEIKQTKDLPCTRTLQFMKNSQGDKLNLTVYMRSNDFIWGASAVNMFNYMFMLEYFAQMLGLEVGEYFHIANNLHYYDGHKYLVQELSKIEDFEDDSFCYKKNFASLSEFDDNIGKLLKWENELRFGKTDKSIEFNDDFFNDWANVLFVKTNRRSVRFANPIVSKLIENYLK
ncbi:MAG: thymidylate synthase [Dysgonomonas sp.]